jgi:hypothetical protein
VLVVEAILVSIALLGLGYLVVDALAPPTTPFWLSLGLALPALMMLVFVAMVAHMISGGGVFQHPSWIRTITAALAAVLLGRKLQTGGGLRPPSPEAWGLFGAVVLAGLVWGSPLARMLPVGHVGDQNLHMGWANQLLNGEATPTAALTGDIPNFYPWLFHALVAFLASFTGPRAFDAQPALLLVQVGGAVLGFYALGRALTRRHITGLGAGLFGAMSGGFGFVMLRGPDLVVDPRAEGGRAAVRFMGDLLYRRSYNLSFHNLAPVFPRDIAYALTCGFLLLLILALERRSRLLLVAAGGALGLIGLTGGETFLVSVAIALLSSFVTARGDRIRAAALVLAPALGLWALWAVPVALNLRRLGGFVDTASALVALPPLAIAGAWGSALPLAILGWLKRPKELTLAGTRVIAIVLVTGAVALLVSGGVARILGPGFTTLGRAHRYWPLLYLGVALLAALGLTAWSDLRVGRSLKIGGSVLVTALALGSPVLGSLALPQVIPSPPPLRTALSGDAHAPLNLLVSGGEQRCTAAVPPDIAPLAFAYSGYRFVWFPYSTEDPTRARIRWAGIYRVITPPGERIRDNRDLLRAPLLSARWRAAARGYGVDRLLRPVAGTRKPSLEAVVVHADCP